MSKSKLKVFCLDWHIHQSDAIREIVNPLRPSFDIELVPWDGTELPKDVYGQASPAVFFQLPPPQSVLENNRARVVWVPMWDHARGYDQSWWDTLPKWVRIVSFSEQIGRRARVAGLPLLSLRYFLDPASLTPVTWKKGPVLFYWNRTGLVGPHFLRELCRVIDARGLVFRPTIDPRVDPRAYYELPEQLGKTKVTTFATTSRNEYLRYSLASNVFLAPRAAEGIGLTFLEAMARGSTVLAYDAPTMNEYIEDSKSGILLRPEPITQPTRLESKLRRLTKRGLAFPHQLTEHRNWTDIESIDLETLGKHARADHEKGYLNWKRNLSSFVNFLCDREPVSASS